MNVLLVEDYPSDTDLVQTYLESVAPGEWEVHHVDRLGEVRGPIERNADVGVFDLALPDATPAQTIERIGELSRSFAIVVMTSRPDDDLELRALEAGAHEFLQKDVIHRELLKRSVDDAIQRYNTLEDLRRRERELEKYRMIVEHSSDAVSVKDAEGRIEIVNERYKRLFGKTESELVGRGISEVFDEERADYIEGCDQRVLQRGEEETVEEQWNDGETTRTLVTTRIPFWDEAGEGAIISIIRDVTERRRMCEDLEERVLYDRLTGLPNRTLFRDRLEQTIERSRRTGNSFALAILNLDDFKAVNDSLGHSAGDELLRAVADRLKEHLRAEDTLARIGSDEFMLILERIDGREELVETGDRLRRLFGEPFETSNSEVHMSVSVGFSLPDLEELDDQSHQEAYESLNRAANRAMHRAKETPGSVWRLQDSAAETSSRRVQRENRIRRALDNGEFLSHFQPVVELDTGSVVAFEMLARWEDPERGLVSPAEFIPLAEKSELIDGISRAILQQGCEKFARHDAVHERFDSPNLYINISVSQLSRLRVLERLMETVYSKLPPSMDVVFEVTESAILRHKGYVDDLRGAGIQIYVDDFGTGHSSLSRLKEMPVDGIKLDMEFVHGIGATDADEAIVEMVAHLGRRLELPTVAEGVETREQFDFLRGVECSAAQGYWLARPAPFENLLEMEISPSVDETSAAGSTE